MLGNMGSNHKCRHFEANFEYIFLNQSHFILLKPRLNPFPDAQLSVHHYWFR